jgi:hypothetical protein
MQFSSQAYATPLPQSTIFVDPNGYQYMQPARANYGPPLTEKVAMDKNYRALQDHLSHERANADNKDRIIQNLQRQLVDMNFT